MNQTSFEVVTAFCRDQRKPDVIRNVALGIYEQQLTGLLQDKTKEKGRVPTEAERATMTETLLSKNSLTALVKLAEDMIHQEADARIRPLLRKQTAREFWFAVGSGVISDIIYSLLIIILFVVAQDQIRSWLSSLQPDPSQSRSVTQPATK